MNTYIRESMADPPWELVREVALARPFGTVITQSKAGELFVSHLALNLTMGMAASDPVSVRFHFAAANPQASATSTADQVLVILHGPDALLLPEWYDHENVPTWDYAYIHITGAPVRLDLAGSEAHMWSLLGQHAPESAVRPELLTALLPAVTAFEIAEPRVQTLFKLSQDKSADSRGGVIAGLEARDDWLDRQTADLIRRAVL